MMIKMNHLQLIFFTACVVFVLPKEIDAIGGRQERSVKKGLPFLCFFPKNSGFGLALLPKYYYKHSEKRCKPFTYHGNGGNSNRFDKIYNCEAVCDVPTCHQTKKSGPCYAKFIRYYHDIDSKKCTWFIWGGCKKNRNNFPSLQKCKDRCE